MSSGNTARKLRSLTGKLSRLPAFRALNERMVFPMMLPRGKPEPTHAPIFIVGAPRSGSTLLYQLLTNCYDFGYISNLHCTLYGAPQLVERCVRGSDFHPPSDNFRSDTGQTEGMKGPCECNAYWYLFFPRTPCYVEVKDMPPEKLRQLEQSVRGLIAAARKPVVFKTQYHSMRLLPLAHAFPDAVFLVTVRDELDNAHSLLECRLKRYNDYSQWMFYDTPDVEELKRLNPGQQVIRYLRTTEDIIQRHSRIIGQERFRWVNYEALCRDPRSVLDEVAAYLKSRTIECSPRGDVPPGFEARKTVRIDPQLYAQMAEYVRANPAPA
ncbi:MAG TPA: sulfotransferase [Verrucomicrobiae bacterium]|jgi:LPS sulfotransferase NodH